MSGAVMLALGAALLAMVAGLFGPQARWWRMAAGLAVALLAAGAWFVAEPAGELGHPLRAEARDASGAPVSTVLVLGQAGGRREVRRAALSRPVEGAEVALWAAIALGLLGAGLQRRASGRRAGCRRGSGWRCRSSARRRRSRSCSARGPPARVKRACGRGWRPTRRAPCSRSPCPRCPGATRSTARSRSPSPPGSRRSRSRRRSSASGAAPARALPALAAALATAAVMAQILAVGGLAWRPVDGALWAVAGLLALAYFDRDAPLRAATLVAPAIALAAIAAGA
ncbi:MAG: hypothetical protein H6705_10135 [Myxococcales bacterium]|nr:hypothetical protein [Myxococcales bacterium]